MNEQIEANMATSIFPHVPETVPPVAERIAADMLRLVGAECRRRIGDHVDWWSAVWESPEATPDEIVGAMGTSAGLFFAIASANRQQIQYVAQVLGKTTAELGVPDKCMGTPREVTVNPDGSVTIGA